MATLTWQKRNKLEKLFNMSSGYVLNFTNYTFSCFFGDYNINIYDEKYNYQGNSKANRFRSFLEEEPDHVVGHVIKGMIDHCKEEGWLLDKPSSSIEECYEIAQQLCGNQPVSDINVIKDIAVDDKGFKLLESQIRSSIDNNQPLAALDRLHTFFVKYFRRLCKKRNIDIQMEKPLHSLAGEYLKSLNNTGHIKSKMTERILKTNISVLDSYNEVRNDHSLAHDNHLLLSHDESVLILNHVLALLRFIESIELSTNTSKMLAIKNQIDDEIPF